MQRLVNLFLSVLTGMLLAAAWPEHGFTPLIFVAFIPMLWMEQRLLDTRRRGVLAWAWLSFFIFNVLTTWWIWNSTEWGSLAAFGLNALFMALAFWLFHLSRKWMYRGRGGLFVLIIFWMTFEYLHMNWDLTWSWLNLGNVFASHPAWIQWYEYTGSLGGTLWVLLVNLLIFQTLHGWSTRRLSLNPVVSIALVMVVVGVPLTWSNYTMTHYQEQGQPVNVVVVQPNTDPYTEQYYLSPDSLLSRMLTLAGQKVNPNTDYLIFPESALQEDIMEGQLDRSRSLNRIRHFLSDYPKLSIITGATTYRNLQPGEPLEHGARKYRDADRYYYAYNTAFLMKGSDELQIHHKSVLTPGAEIMPSWGILKPLEALAVDLGGTTGTLKKEDHPVAFIRESTPLNVSPVICYESVYGEFVARSVRLGAGFIAVITNDGWWGNTPGYRQHLLFSVLRAIESRREVARSANTGISAFIDQRGVILEKTGYWVPAVIEHTLYSNDIQTYYTQNGDYLGRIAAFAGALVLLITLTQGYLKKYQKIRE